MTKKTHIYAGVATGILCNISAPCLVLVGVGALLPDIDLKNSTLGKKLSFLSIFLEHRGFTHSLLFLAITFLINPYIGLGVFSHILLDMLNPKGVQLFAPFKPKIGLPLIKTNSTGEKIFCGFLTVIITIFVIYNGIVKCDANIYQEFFTIFQKAEENLLNLIAWIFSLLP